MTCLCALEAVNLDNLFGDCQDLSTTRGGGLAVLEIANRVAQALHAVPISTGASQGLLRIEGDDAATVEKSVRAELDKLDLSEHTTIMVSACEEEGEEEFPRQVAALKARMRWGQMQSPSVVYPELHGQLVCDIDGVRPALFRQDLEKKKHQSDFTYERRNFGRGSKRDLLRHILDPQVGKFDVVEDLNELADDDGRYGNSGDKIAVLRFDGNKFGEIAEKCVTPILLKTFSETTREQQKAFFRSLIRSEQSSVWFTDHSPPRIRLEVIVYGGDEVAFITPAWLGWKALLCFYREAKSWPPLQFGDEPKNLTYSGGVVFCHRNAPIHSAKRLASELTDQAKDKGDRHNSAAYQALESFDAIGQDIDDFVGTDKFFGNRALALGLDAIDCIEQNMEHWRATLSKRRLHILVTDLMTGGTVELDTAIARLVEFKNAASENAANSIKALHGMVGNVAFLHILELWDYAGIAL